MRERADGILVLGPALPSLYSTFYYRQNWMETVETFLWFKMAMPSFKSKMLDQNHIQIGG